MENNSRTWRKSTYSGATSGNCVEVGGVVDQVLVRDTRDRETFTLCVSAQAWQAFTKTLKE